MELEEMKNLWEEMGEKIDKQELLTTQLLEKTTKQNYHSRLNKIKYSEFAGAIICYLGAIYLIMNFIKIEQVPEKIFGVISIGLLLILPIISLRYLNSMNDLRISSNTYKETINDYGKRKIRFQKFQKLNISLGLFLILIAIPVLSAIKGENLSDKAHFWTIIFPIAILGFLGFSYWVIKSYNKNLDATEKMLSDINN